MVADFRSEQVADIILECMADFIGIRSQAGLIEQSRAPLRPAARKVDVVEMEALILDLRRTRSLGVKRLRNELVRQHDLQLSLDTIHRVLVRHGAQHLDQARLRRKGARQYSLPIPGDRVQMNVCKIAPGIINTRRSMIVAATRYLAFIQDEMQRALCPSLSASWRKCRFLSSAFRLIAGSSSLPKMSNAG